VRLEPTLLARLLSDIVDQPGALPMFQYALTELYERRSDDVLTEAAYEELGGVRGAITNRAEELYQGLSPEEQAAARQLFLRLVAISDTETWTRRRVRAAEIISLDLDVVALQAAIDRFGTHRLLLFDRDEVSGSPTVEVGHEALLSEWPRLEGWIRDARGDLVRHAAFASAMAEWERADRDPGFVVTGARLAEYERWATSSTVELNARELDFLGAAIEAREADIRADEERAARELSLAGRARRRLWALVAAVATLIGVVAVVFLTASDPKPRVAVIQAGDSVGAGLATLGLEEAERRFDVDIDTIRPPWTSVEAVQNTLAESGTDLILIDAALDLGAAEFLAREHPDTKFAVFFSGIVDSAPPNYVGYVFADEESAYLAGVAAAMETATGTVGFVGAYPVEDVTDRLAGFRQGSRSINPDIEVLVSYLNDSLTEVGEFNLEVELFHRPDMGKAAALEQFQAGADVVFHAAGDSGLGVFEAARETTEATDVQVWGIGADADQYFDVPVESREYVLMSAVRRIDAVVLDAVEMVVTDQFQSGNRLLTLANGGVDYARSGDKLDPATIGVIEAAKQAIISGEILVQGILPAGAAVPSQGSDESGYGLVAGRNVLTAVGNTIDRPLYRFEDDSFILTGFEVELLDEIAGRLGLEVQHVDTDFRQMIPDVAAGRYDVAMDSLDITPGRQEIVAITSPHLRNPAVLVVSASSGITGMDDVTTVVVHLGSSFEELMRSSFPEVELLVQAGRLAPGEMLRNGEADGWVTQLAPELEDDETLSVAETVAEAFSAYMVNPALSDLLADMNTALTDMIADGTYADIYAGWFDTPEFRVDLP
jgi:basic membrane lipoprotein Med (substrate-binding protein (PBP1-ABC) superfamily)